MTDRPMIFSAPMIRALLAGAKTQTRRVLKLPTKNIYERKDMGGWAPTTHGTHGTFTIARDGTRRPVPETVGIWHQTTGTCLNAPNQVGDRLWVREAWGHDAPDLDSCRRGVESDGPKYGPYYMADARWFDNATVTKRSPIHIPRWASRLTLTVTDVRVQRLQDISEDDARAEGVEPQHEPSVAASFGRTFGVHHQPYRSAYANLWESIHGAGAWSANPWVTALSFTVARANIDALAKEFA